MARFSLDRIKPTGYSLFATDGKGGTVNLSPLIKRITLAGSLDQAAMRLDVELAHYPGLEGMVECGNQLVLYGPRLEDGKDFELTRGYVFERERMAGTDGGMKLVALDLLAYLLKNKDDFVFRGVKASHMIETVCRTFGIPTGTIADTGHYIPKLIGRNMSLYDLFVKALVITRNHTGEKFFLRGRQGKLILEKRPAQPEMWVLEAGVNLQAARLSESIQDMRNRVVIRSHAKDDERSNILAVAEDRELMQLYGLLQEVQLADEDAKDKAGANAIARQLLRKLGKVSRTASVTAVGLTTLRPGDPVIVSEPSTGLQGTYYAKEVTLTVDGSNVSMDVTLSWDGDDEEEDADGGAGFGSEPGGGRGSGTDSGSGGSGTGSGSDGGVVLMSKDAPAKTPVASTTSTPTRSPQELQALQARLVTAPNLKARVMEAKRKWWALWVANDGRTDLPEQQEAIHAAESARSLADANGIPRAEIEPTKAENWDLIRDALVAVKQRWWEARLASDQQQMTRLQDLAGSVRNTRLQLVAEDADYRQIAVLTGMTETGDLSETQNAATNRPYLDRLDAAKAAWIRHLANMARTGEPLNGLIQVDAALQAALTPAGRYGQEQNEAVTADFIQFEQQLEAFWGPVFDMATPVSAYWDANAAMAALYRKYDGQLPALTAWRRFQDRVKEFDGHFRSRVTQDWEQRALDLSAKASDLVTRWTGLLPESILTPTLRTWKQRVDEANQRLLDAKRKRWDLLEPLAGALVEARYYALSNELEQIEGAIARVAPDVTISTDSIHPWEEPRRERMTAHYDDAYIDLQRLAAAGSQEDERVLGLSLTLNLLRPYLENPDLHDQELQNRWGAVRFEDQVQALVNGLVWRSVAQANAAKTALDQARGATAETVWQDKVKATAAPRLNDMMPVLADVQVRSKVGTATADETRLKELLEYVGVTVPPQTAVDHYKAALEAEMKAVYACAPTAEVQALAQKLNPWQSWTREFARSDYDKVQNWYTCNDTIRSKKQALWTELGKLTRYNVSTVEATANSLAQAVSDQRSAIALLSMAGLTAMPDHTELERTWSQPVIDGPLADLQRVVDENGFMQDAARRGVDLILRFAPPGAGRGGSGTGGPTGSFPSKWTDVLLMDVFRPSRLDAAGLVTLVRKLTARYNKTDQLLAAMDSGGLAQLFAEVDSDPVNPVSALFLLAVLIHESDWGTAEWFTKYKNTGAYWDDAADDYYKYPDYRTSVAKGHQSLISLYKAEGRNNLALIAPRYAPVGDNDGVDSDGSLYNPWWPVTIAELLSMMAWELNWLAEPIAPRNWADGFSVTSRVSEVQAKLKPVWAEPDKDASLSGQWDRRTQASLAQFQYFNGLAVTGIVDEPTRQALFGTPRYGPAAVEINRYGQWRNFMTMGYRALPPHHSRHSKTPLQIGPGWSAESVAYPYPLWLTFTGDRGLCYPLEERTRITDYAGSRLSPADGAFRSHTGTDYGAPTGTPLYAVWDGKVVERHEVDDGSYGYFVVLEHRDDLGSTFYSLYAHLSSIEPFVKKGEFLKRGDYFARVGTTGGVPAHLHFEIFSAYAGAPNLPKGKGTWAVPAWNCEPMYKVYAGSSPDLFVGFPKRLPNLPSP